MRRPLFMLLLLALPLSLQQQGPPPGPIAPGVTFDSQRLTEGPWEVRAVRVQRAAPDIGLEAALGQGQLRGVEPISGIIARETRPDDYVVAGFNADFFVMAGNPNAGLVSGLHVQHGELVMTARGRPAFAVLNDGTPRLGVFDTSGTVTLPSGPVPLAGLNEPARTPGFFAYTHVFGWPITRGGVAVALDRLPLALNGMWRGKVTARLQEGTAREVGEGEVVLSGAGDSAAVLAALQPGDPVQMELRTPALPEPAQTAVSGNLILMRDGQLLVKDKPSDPRHPRTAVGFNGKEIIFAVVDGRRAGWSVGMTYYELALLMQRLGCTDAMNLDGGGSSTAWVRGRATNRPSDGGERKIANAVLVRSRAPHGRLARLQVAPSKVTALSGAAVPLELYAVDDWYNPVPLPAGQLRAETPPGCPLRARLSGTTLHVSGPAGETTLRLALPGRPEALAELPLRLVDRCDSLAVQPSSLELCAGDAVRLSCRGLTAGGEEVALRAGAAGWSASGTGLQVWQDGTVRARVAGARGAVRVRVGPAEVEAPVAVADESVLESFEVRPDAAAQRAHREPLPGAAPVWADATAGARAAVRLMWPLPGEPFPAAEGSGYCRLIYNLGRPTGTRASYLRVDRPLGHALRLSLRVRGRTGAAPWLRVAVLDGNGTRQTYDAAAAVDWGPQWRRLQVRLPATLRQPLTWESVYVVATEGKTGRGTVDVDDLRVEAVSR